jgi:hypothetical protein
MSILRALLVLIVVVSQGGCLGSQKQTLREAVFEYTHGVRWGRHSHVTRYLAVAGQRRYIMARERIADLRVTKCRVAAVRAATADKATVMLSVDWFRLSRGKVQRTMVEQDWRLKGTKWLVTRQAVVRGAPLPIFPNPAAAAAISGRPPARL